MAAPQIAGMNRTGIAGTVRAAAETAAIAVAPNVATRTGMQDGVGETPRIAIGSLKIRVPHNATARDLADAIQRALLEHAK